MCIYVYYYLKNSKEKEIDAIQNFSSQKLKKNLIVLITIENFFFDTIRFVFFYFMRIFYLQTKKYKNRSFFRKVVTFSKKITCTNRAKSSFKTDFQKFLDGIQNQTKIKNSVSWIAM